MLTIAVDAMGGDLGPRVAFQACKSFLKTEPEVRILLPLEEEHIPSAKKILSRFAERVDIVSAESHVCMTENPKTALRNFEQSTMGLAMLAHKNKDADGVLSIGSTGALLVLARRLLNTLDGVERPALATQLPTKGKPLLMMDLGANVFVSSSQLVQLAYLAVAWYRSVGVENPQVGLLNIGSEPGKGPDFVRTAASDLTHSLEGMYQGFVEGDHLFEGELDAVICDGFSGNIVLKTTEGLIDWLTQMMGSSLRESLALRWSLPIWKATMNRIDRQVSPARHGGAMLLGIKGHVAKTHGKSDMRTFRYALEYLVQEIRDNDPKDFEREFKQLVR